MKYFLVQVVWIFHVVTGSSCFTTITKSLGPLTSLFLQASPQMWPVQQSVPWLLVPAATSTHSHRRPCGPPVPPRGLWQVVHQSVQPGEPHWLFPRGAAALCLHSRRLWEKVHHETEPPPSQHRAWPSEEETEDAQSFTVAGLQAQWVQGHKGGAGYKESGTWNCQRVWAGHGTSGFCWAGVPPAGHVLAVQPCCGHTWTHCRPDSTSHGVNKHWRLHHWHGWNVQFTVWIFSIFSPAAYTWGQLKQDFFFILLIVKSRKHISSCHFIYSEKAMQ